MAKFREIDAVKKELEQAGIRYSVIENGHYKVLFTVKGKKCLLTVAKTGSDWRGIKNARALVRRTIKQATQG